MVAATLQEVSGGRFLLGLGAGSEQFLGWAGHRAGAAAGHDQDGAGRLAGAARPRGRGPGAAAGMVRPGQRAQVPAGAAGSGLHRRHGPEDARDGRPARGRRAAAALPARALRQRAPAGAGRRRATASRDVDLPACFWVSLSDDPVAARTALAEKLAYYGPSISAPVLAAAGLRAAGLRRGRPAGPRRARGGPAHRRPHAVPGGSRGRRGRAGPLPGARAGWAPATFRSARRSGRTRWRRSACSATRCCQP